MKTIILLLNKFDPSKIWWLQCSMEGWENSEIYSLRQQEAVFVILKQYVTRGFVNFFN